MLIRTGFLQHYDVKTKSIVCTEGEVCVVICMEGGEEVNAEEVDDGLVLHHLYYAENVELASRPLIFL